MKEKSIKLNFIMNVILTGSTYIFPLITFPYVSRVLQATGNGRVGFATSIINYFVMIASLGIPLYGVRACSIVRSNKEELSRTVREIFLINLATSIFSYILLIIFVMTVPKVREYSELIWILSSLIFLNLIGVEWLYKALEEYSYITIRSIAFKVIGILLMFIFVREPEDYIIYAAVSVIGSSGSMIFNAVRIKKYINIVNVTGCNIKRHIKPMLTFCFLAVSWTVYTNLDSVMLGFISGDEEVGYYTAAVKIKLILASTVSALGTVLLPRLSSYFYQKKETEFYTLLKKNSSFITIASLALIGFFVVNARETILILSGQTYILAVPAMQAIMFSIIFIGFSTLLGTNVLVPMGKEHVTTIATMCGILVNVCLNIYWIPQFGALGAAIATVIGEFIVVLIELFYLREYLIEIFDLRTLAKCVLSLTISLGCMIMIKTRIEEQVNSTIMILILGIIFGGSYLGLLVAFKESFVCDLVNKVIRPLNNKHHA